MFGGIGWDWEEVKVSWFRDADSSGAVKGTVHRPALPAAISPGSRTAQADASGTCLNRALLGENQVQKEPERRLHTNIPPFSKFV